MKIFRNVYKSYNTLISHGFGEKKAFRQIQRIKFLCPFRFVRKMNLQSEITVSLGW